MGASVNTLRIAYFGASLSVLASFAAPHQAAAMEGWGNDGKPLFRSDTVREEQEWDRQRFLNYRKRFPEHMSGGGQPAITPVAPPIVALDKPEPAGTIIVDTRGKRMFYVLPDNKAYQYPISVGRIGFTWTGTQKISRVADWPTWTPPPEMIAREPWLPRTMTGGVNNPLGAKALYLGDSLYRIHGTNDPKTIGFASSSGCFRMMNHHVTHLATMAGVGTEVRVVSRYEQSPGPGRRPAVAGAE
jgi:lipoprotein-anchoring transpeptidase ErfK/SrfK